MGGVRPCAGINSAFPRLTARPRGAGGCRAAALARRLRGEVGALGGSALRPRACPGPGFRVSSFSFLGERRRRGATGKARSRAFPPPPPSALSPQRGGDAGGGSEFAAPERGSGRRVSSCRSPRQPLPRGAPPAPRSPAAARSPARRRPPPPLAAAGGGCPPQRRRMQFRLFSFALIILNCVDDGHCQAGRWRRSKRGEQRRLLTRDAGPGRPAAPLAEPAGGCRGGCVPVPVPVPVPSPPRKGSSPAGEPPPRRGAQRLPRLPPAGSGRRTERGGAAASPGARGRAGAATPSAGLPAALLLGRPGAGGAARA